ncbi:MAG: hypothetical protein H6884_07205 [Rhodobiaceae bacterium]|nr:hypothetical protein [Rhodobiaceae bacterium]MCC0042555.1 hypothetical protein [Rhodobiaceae bacterium]MCC0053829.1 hypothetical protein [Rhodobiaceae bacterium]
MKITSQYRMAAKALSKLQKFTTPQSAAASDDLTKISGIGVVYSKKLKAIGFSHFSQIAKLSKVDITRIERHLGIKGRIARDNWIAQARTLAVKKK